MENLETVARTLAGLYNHAQPQALGRFQYVPGRMPYEEAYGWAKQIIEGGEMYFDYLTGRTMKVTIRADGSVPSHRLYDRDNGEGAAAAAIEDGLTDPRYKPHT